MKTTQTTIDKYNLAQDKTSREICKLLKTEIDRNLKKFESKIWHGAPVWFLNGNPIVGYSKQKMGIKLMFWSGADFKENKLNIRGGKFKDASIIYSGIDEIRVQELKRWIKKAAEIQWNYKDIVRNKGKLTKLQIIKTVPEKKCEIKDGIAIKYHVNGKTVWSKGKILNGKTDGYWEWYRPDGTKKRSGFFEKGEPVGEWITYDNNGEVYKKTIRQSLKQKNEKNRKKVSEKMIIKPEMRAIILNAPKDIINKLELPPLKFSKTLTGAFDYIHIFVIHREELERELPRLKAFLAPKGKLWVSWPKNGKLGTNLKLQRDIIPIGYYNGLVESVCLSVDKTWSGLRFTHPIKGKQYNNGHAKLRLSE